MRFALIALLCALAAGCGSGARGDDGAAFTNPVIAGQHPDPSAIRAADGSFWLATTSRAWAPLFPLFHSRDLVDWRRVGGLLERAPRWAAGPFWAPELLRWGDGVRAYYTARPRGRRDPLPCIGVATAARPAGPYRDRGRPLACPRGGAIDAFVARDEHGRPQLLYRRYRDGGGIWALPLRADGLALRPGRPAARLLLAPGPDDGGVVEGPAVVRRGGWFTLLFATGSCCRPPCDYEEAAARSRSLLGPYVRAPRPLLRDGARLRCNGHGTVVGDGRGRRWLLHHGVLADDPLNVRRAVVLDPLRWDDDGWPAAGDDGRPLDGGPAPLGVAQRPAPPPTPSLAGTRLDPAWEWPWDAPADARQRGGAIELRGAPGGAVLARQVPAGDLRATVRVRARGCAAGLAAVSGGQTAGETYGIELTPGGGAARAWQGATAGGAGETLATAALAGAGAAGGGADAAGGGAGAAGGGSDAAAAASGGDVELAVTIRDGGEHVGFAARRAGDGAWRELGTRATTPVNQRAIRIALTCRGPRATSARFSDLRIAAG